MARLSDDARRQSPNQLPDYPINQLLDLRSASAIGRRARLELVFEARGGRTVIARAYAEPPFRIGRSFDVDGAAYVILVCSGPGVFAGDALDLSIRVRPGARVILASQSALQVHPSAASTPALIRHRYVVEEDGELQAHWDPVIPFAGARLDQRFELQIDEPSRLYWSDALMSGRVDRAETWSFDCVAHELRLRVGTTSEVSGAIHASTARALDDASVGRRRHALHGDRPHASRRRDTGNRRAHSNGRSRREETSASARASTFSTLVS